MHYPFTLLPLPYAHNALEPYIDEQTMHIHHGKHLQTYVDNLNKALEPHQNLHDWPLERLLYNLDKLPAAIQTPVRNAGGGVYNHNLYFSVMGPAGKPLADGTLKTAITRDFGSMDEFLQQLKAAGLAVFGSGWAWLVADNAGKLSIYKTPNQETQIGDNLTPIMILDTWEHAYYLKSQNRRAEHIDNWFNVINWQAAQANYDNYSKTDYSKA